MDMYMYLYRKNIYIEYAYIHFKYMCEYIHFLLLICIYIYIYTICVCVYTYIYIYTWIYTQGVANLFSKTLMPWLAWLGRSHNALAIVIAQAAGDAARCPILAASAVQFWTTRLQFRRRIYFFFRTGIIQDKGEKKTLTPTNIVFVDFWKFRQKKNCTVLNSVRRFFGRLSWPWVTPSEWVIDVAYDQSLISNFSSSKSVPKTPFSGNFLEVTPSDLTIFVKANQLPCQLTLIYKHQLMKLKNT